MKLSIITVNLNNKDGLQKTIDSVISQTFKDFEWIVIDGGSTDGSKELIEKFSNHISYWVSEPDKGIYNAMNKGIRVARGEYLEFLNSGDIFFDNKTLYNLFSASKESDILYTNAFTLKDGKLERINYHNDYLTCYRLTKRTINHQSAFIRRKLFYDYGFYDESLKIVSDWKFFFEAIVVKKCSVRHIDLNAIIYDGNGISSANPIRLRDERITVLKQYLPEYAIDDYLIRLEMNELLNHRPTSFIISFLYRIVVKLEKMGFIIKCF